MNNTRKLVILFLILSFLVIIGISVFRGVNYENNKNDYEKSEEKENSANKKPHQSEQSSLHDSTNSNVDHEKEIIKIKISVTGLHKEVLIDEVIEIENDKSAFDVLKKVCDKYEYEIKTTGFSKYIYVQSINGLKEKQHGAKSGWKYNINGEYMASSAGSYLLKSNDVVEWYYEHD